MPLTPDVQAFIKQFYAESQDRATRQKKREIEAWRLRNVARKERLVDPNDQCSESDYRADLAADPMPAGEDD